MAEDSPTPSEPEPVTAAAEPAPPQPAAAVEPTAATPEPEPEPVPVAPEPVSPKAPVPAAKARPVAAAKAKPTPANARREKAGSRKEADGATLPIVRAQAKYVRTSARKARLVCDHIRGKSVVEARAILAFAPRAVAQDWAKLLNSAVANAENNHELVGDDLRVLSAFADEGPTLKRFRPRAMGRATPIRKRTSHLTITLTPKE